MSREILVPIDGSDPAWQALEFALEQHADADITAYCVVNIMAAPPRPMLGQEPMNESELYEDEREHAHSVLSEAETLAEEYDTDIETETVFGLPRDAIIDYAEDDSFDQIIMGSHGRSGLKRVVIGSVAEKVTRHASVPVTIVHAETGS